MSDITIGIIASAREWRSVLQAHVRDHVAGVRVQILREPRMALELNLDVVVIDDVSSFLTRDKVVRLREKGTRVVGIYDPEGNEGLGISFLENLGVDLSLPSTISPEEMINAVSQLQPRENYGHSFDHIVGDFSPSRTVQTTTHSTMIAVSGPAGAGSTEIAIALSDIVASRNHTTLLLDCDEVGPSVARRLGFHLHPNILSAIDAVSNASRPLTEMVGRPGDHEASLVNFDVMPGIASAEDWAQLRSMDLEDLFTAARKSWRYIVCNTGPFAEDLSGYGIERFGATRATLAEADVIIGVMSPTPTGYMRFLDWMASIRTLGADRPVYIAVNRTPKSAYIRAEIESQIARDVDPRFFAELFFIPEDERVAKAEWEGQRVGRGPFLNAVAEMSASVLVEYAPPLNEVQSAPTLYTQAPRGGYTPGYQAESGPHQAPSVSWDDPDIAYSPPPSPQNNSFAGPGPAKEVSLEEARGYFPDNTQSLASHEVAEWEATLNQSMSPPVRQHDDHYDEPASDPLPARESQPYSYSPPQHSVEQFSVPTAVPPIQPSQPSVPSAPAHVPNIGEAGYVPSFKRGVENDPNLPPSSGETNSPASPVDPSMYTSPHQSPHTETPKSGYVPHFIDEKQEQDKDSFWDES